jgi:hypothetical protein
MKAIEFATYVRYKTRTNSTTFTDDEILALMKIRQDEIARSILEVDEDILLIPQTTDLVEDQRTYTFPDDILARIKRVEAKLDGTNWLKLYPMDMTEFGYALTESNITTYYSNVEGEAYYDIYRKSLYLMTGSIIDVTDGLKIWTNTYPAVITDLSGTTDMSTDPSTSTHGIPRELHEIWARGVIIDYKESREKPIPLSEREQKYEYDKMKVIYAMRNQDLDREVIGHLPSASDRGNNGENY